MTNQIGLVHADQGYLIGLRGNYLDNKGGEERLLGIVVFPTELKTTEIKRNMASGNKLDVSTENAKHRI